MSNHTSTAAPQVMYTETAGCTTVIPEIGGRLTVTGFKYGPGVERPEPRTAFVFDDVARQMHAVEIGGRVAACTCGRDALYGVGAREHHERCNVNSGRKSHSAILSHRPITRDEFDVLTGIAEARVASGWRA